MRRQRQAGVTLMEMLIAITLLSFLTAGMLMAMRIGLNVFAKANDRLMENRRVAGAQRILEQEIEGLLPAVTQCGPMPLKIGFFQGEPQTMRLVSTFSLQDGWRGLPQVLELFVIPGENSRGVRLVVNELPYAGPRAVGQLCMGPAGDPMAGGRGLRFLPVQATPKSFVLADNLDYCRFVYLSPAPIPGQPAIWTARWTNPGWPMAVRVEMAPLEPNPGHLQPITVEAPIHIRRSLDLEYADQ